MIWINRASRRSISRITSSLSCLRRHQHVNVQAKSSPVKNASQLVEGASVEGFIVTQIAPITDFNCRLIRLRHSITGAQYMHIERNDSNNVFAIAFRTTPFDSTGLPHILEHITLMGSKKYPCRDPFFKMLNRSLATYINACTAPDFTVYPFATQNVVDYYNLMSVYLDAVFRPKLRENDFKLEGWRLEHEEVTDRNSPIIFKGVVFNEMKGVFSENQNIFMEKMLNSIMPSHTYGVVSGGDPLHIPNLTHEKLVRFQRAHYHPSNCRIYSYGNFNFIDHLKFVHENYLSQYEYNEKYAKNTFVPSEPRWEKPRRVHVAGRNDPLAADASKQSIVGVTYLCEDIKRVKDQFELKILSQLLLDGPNASFYRTLIEPNIGSGYSPGTGFDAQTRDSIFSVGLQGISEADFERVESAVYKTFDQCLKEGFDKDNIENILHGVELNVKHKGADFGMQLLFSLSSLWNHDGDLFESMRITDQVTSLRSNLADDRFYLQKLMERYFIGNNHRLILTMSPDEEYENRLKSKELKSLEMKLKTVDRQQVYEQGIEIQKMIEAPDDITCLPTLKISDISRSREFPNVDEGSVNGVKMQLCSLPTNNVAYFRALLDISKLSESEKMVLPLFAQVVTEMGTRSHDYRAFDKMIYRKTLGLNVGVNVADDLHDSGKFEEGVTLGSLCLDSNVDDMFTLWANVFNEVSLADPNRFQTLVQSIASGLANSVADSGQRYAMMSASARVGGAAHRREQFGGLTFVQKMKEIAGSSDLSGVLEDMRSIAVSILNKNRVRCALNVSPNQSDMCVNALNKFVGQMAGACEGDVLQCSASTSDPHSNENIHIVLPFAVNYTAKAVATVPFLNDDFPALRVLCKLLTTRYLLPSVRERYGAYGTGAAISQCGTINFYSYRDPNTVNTIGIFDEAGKWLERNEFTESDVAEAKLGVFRDLDAPTAPSDEGMRLFLSRIDDKTFAKHRIRVLDVDRESLLRVGAEYLNDGRPSAKVIIGPECDDIADWKKVKSE